MITRKLVTKKRKHAAGFAGLLLCALTSTAALSNDRVDAFHVVAIEDQAGGELVTSGQFAAAAEKIGKTKSKRRSFAAHNNLCVAYIKLRNIELARKSCDAAIASRGRAADKLEWRPRSDSGLRQRDRAVALSNRGVVRALSGELDGAQADFEEAARLFEKLEETHINLAKLSRRIEDKEFTAQNAL